MTTPGDGRPGMGQASSFFAPSEEEPTKEGLELQPQPSPADDAGAATDVESPRPEGSAAALVEQANELVAQLTHGNAALESQLGALCELLRHGGALDAELDEAICGALTECCTFPASRETSRALVVLAYLLRHFEGSTDEQICGTCACPSPLFPAAAALSNRLLRWSRLC